MTLRTLAATLCLLALAALSAPTAGQPRPQTAGPEVAFRVLSAETTRFPKPLRLGGPRGKPTVLAQAFLVRVEVPAAQFDALPPDMEPFLYIGRHELRTFAIDRPKEGRTLIVTYYSPEAPSADLLRADAPMVLTLDHGAPQRDPRRFLQRRDLQRFKPEWLQASKP